MFQTSFATLLQSPCRKEKSILSVVHLTVAPISCNVARASALKLVNLCLHELPLSALLSLGLHFCLQGLLQSILLALVVLPVGIKWWREACCSAT